jgi:hypothetical protein
MDMDDLRLALLVQYSNLAVPKDRDMNSVKILHPRKKEDGLSFQMGTSELQKTFQSMLQYHKYLLREPNPRH